MEAYLCANMWMKFIKFCEYEKVYSFSTNIIIVYYYVDTLHFSKHICYVEMWTILQLHTCLQRSEQSIIELAITLSVLFTKIEFSDKLSFRNS